MSSIVSDGLVALGFTRYSTHVQGVDRVVWHKAPEGYWVWSPSLGCYAITRDARGQWVPGADTPGAEFVPAVHHFKDPHNGRGWGRADTEVLADITAWLQNPGF